MDTIICIGGLMDFTKFIENATKEAIKKTEAIANTILTKMKEKGISFESPELTGVIEHIKELSEKISQEISLKISTEIAREVAKEVTKKYLKEYLKEVLPDVMKELVQESVQTNVRKLDGVVKSFFSIFTEKDEQKDNSEEPKKDTESEK